MKKHHIREERTCLNCGTEVTDRFCSHCGQENKDPQENIGQLINHFFADITHYDSKFFKTIKDLLLRPGFLTKEYLAGRRASYLNPVRMYVFISFLFFLIYFTISTSGVKIGPPEQKPAMTAIQMRLYRDSIINAGVGEISDTATRSMVLRASRKQDWDLSKLNFENFKTVAQFDSAQRAKPDSERISKLPAYFIRKQIRMHQLYGSQWKEMLFEDFKHNLPKLMFILLPLFALLLKIFYSWKKYYYVDHAIFSIHIHSFIFLLFLIDLLLDTLMHTSFFGLISILVIFVYFVLALKNTYHQSVFLSIVKASVISFLYAFVMILGLTFTAIYTFISI
jgi:hypothetical protein